MDRDRHQIVISFEGRTIVVAVGMMRRILDCASSHLYDIKAALTEKPLDWDNDLVRAEFDNRMEDILYTKNAIHDAACLRSWLRTQTIDPEPSS